MNRVRGMSAERGVEMTRTVETKKVSLIGQAMTTYHNSDAAVRHFTRCALAALAFPLGAAVKFIWN